MKLTSLVRGQPVRVHWRDAYSNSGWLDPAEYERWRVGVAHVITVSHYVDHDKTNMHLAQSVRGDRLADIIEIPLALIDKLERLK